MNFIKKHNKSLHALVILLTVAVNLSFFADYSLATSRLAFVKKWGSVGVVAPVSSLQIAISTNNNNIYVTDADNHIVNIFDKNGAFISSFGSEGTGDGEFQYPWGVAVASNGNVYVADSSNHRIQYFSPIGNYLGQFGSYGSGKGKFNFPHGVAISINSVVYVTDTLNHRIETFDLSGSYLGQFGTEGSAPNQFEFPEDVGVSSAGNVYVSDSSNHTIKVFTATGTFLNQFGTQGSASGQFNFPKGIAVSSAGSVYVADSGNYRFLQFTIGGTYQSTFGTQGVSMGEFNAALDGAIAPNGNVYIADGGNHRVQVFSASGTFIASFSVDPTIQNTDGKFNFPSGIFKDPSGTIYVADTKNNRIEIFDEDGVYSSQFGVAGSGNGQLSNPSDVGVNKDGKIFVTDTGNSRIEIFNADGTYSNQFGAMGNNSGEFNEPNGIAVLDGKLYVADTQNNRIQIFDETGSFIRSIGDGDGVIFSGPADVAVDNKGNIYVADTNNDKIQMFDASGLFVNEFAVFVRNPDSNADPVDGAFSRPLGIAVDEFSHIFVSDTNNNRIEVINTDGDFVTKIGVLGNGNAEFSKPFGLSVGTNNHVYVVDSLHQRVQEFQFEQVPPPPPPSDTSFSSGGAVINIVDPVITTNPPHANPVVAPVLPQPIIETINTTILPVAVTNVISTVVRSVVEPVRIAIAQIEEVTPVPLKTYIPKTIMNSGLLVGSVAMITDNLFATPMTLAQILLFPARMWANFLTALGIRKRRRPWGAVYDTTTKQPLDPVRLELVNKDGYVVARTSTDIYGRYSFKVSPGHYMLRPRKDGYVFPSLALARMDRDEVYKDLYFGNYFEINHAAEMINKNVPMDRTTIDWHQFMEQDQKMLSWLARRDELITKASKALFVAGFIISLLALLLAPRAYTIIVFLLYIFMYLLRRTGANPSKLGKVTDKSTRAPLSFAIVRVFSLKLGNEVVRKATNKFGQFFCPVPDGDYYLSFDRRNENGTYTEANKKELVHITRGVVSGRWEASF